MSTKRCVRCETPREQFRLVRLLYCAGAYWKGIARPKKLQIAQLMKIRFLPANSILFGLFASVALAQAALAQTPPAGRAHTRNLTVDDYFRIKDVEDAQISPDGKWVAYVVTSHDVKEDKDKKRIWMAGTSGAEAIPLPNE